MDTGISVVLLVK